MNKSLLDEMRKRADMIFNYEDLRIGKIPTEFLSKRYVQSQALYYSPKDRIYHFPTKVQSYHVVDKGKATHYIWHPANNSQGDEVIVKQIESFKEKYHNIENFTLSKFNKFWEQGIYAQINFVNLETMEESKNYAPEEIEIYLLEEDDIPIYNIMLVSHFGIDD